MSSNLSLNFIIWNIPTNLFTFMMKVTKDVLRISMIMIKPVNLLLMVVTGIKLEVFELPSNKLEIMLLNFSIPS